MDQNEVGIAFDIVLEEIEDVIAALNQEGAQAFQSSKYEAARDLMEQGSRMIAFREKVKDLQKESSNIFSMVARERVKKKKGGNVSERLKRGLRTTEDNFRAPMLEALIALGDSGPVVDVLNKVEILMKDQLNSYEMQPL